MQEIQNLSIDEEFAEAAVPATPAQPATVAEPASAMAEEDAMPSVPAEPIAIAVPLKNDAATKSAEDAELERLMAETGMAQ